jgi:hypothetical protein
MALVACPGGDGKTAQSVGKKPQGTQAPRARAAAPTGVPKVVLQVGTSFETGRLSSFCEGKRCSVGSSSPATYLEATHPLFFILSAAPRSAALQIASVGNSAAPSRSPLHPGNSMAYDPDVEPGRYVLTLEASWGRRSGRWIFGIEVPERR